MGEKWAKNRYLIIRRVIEERLGKGLKMAKFQVESRWREVLVLLGFTENWVRLFWGFLRGKWGFGRGGVFEGKWAEMGSVIGEKSVIFGDKHCPNLGKYGS